jgi:hypothetical protein
VKVWSIEKNAGIFHESRDDFAVLFDARRAVFSLGFKLPLVIGQSFGGLFDPTTIFFVTEVCSVTATSLHEFRGRFGQDALAPVAENTRPVAFEEGDVKHPRSLASSVFKTDPFVGVARY